MRNKRIHITGVATLLYIFSTVLVSGQPVPDSKPVVAGFYPLTKVDVLKPEEISITDLTHLIYCFAAPQKDGSITTEFENYHNAAFVERVHRAGKKFIIMVGGGSQSKNFHHMVSSQVARAAFIQTLNDWMTTYGYDGINIDWEYPGDHGKSEDKDNLTALVRELRTSFNALETRLGKHLEISMDVHSLLYYGQWIDFKALSKYMDWFGLMAYDYTGDWPSCIHAAHNAPLYCGPAQICKRYLSVDQGLKNLRDSSGVSPSQIVLGVPFYGREFQNASLYETPRKGGEGISYYEIASLIGNGWTRHWDEQSKVPYLLKDSGSGFISYDDAASLELKIDYIKRNNLRGVMIWEITHDVDTVTKEQTLLKIVSKKMGQQ